MRANPQVIQNSGMYVIRFIRANSKVLMYVQGHTRKMKDINFVNAPIVQFFSRKDAEREVREVVIPYLLRDKGVEPSEIIGW